jgi:hypothetical protein
LAAALPAGAVAAAPAGGVAAGDCAAGGVEGCAAAGADAAGLAGGAAGAFFGPHDATTISAAARDAERSVAAINRGPDRLTDTSCFIWGPIHRRA